MELVEMYTGVLKQIIRDYPDALGNEKRFIALIRDLIHNKKIENLIMTGFRAGIIQDCLEKTEFDRLTHSRHVNNLINNYGIDKKNAEIAIDIIERTFLDITPIDSFEYKIDGSEVTITEYTGKDNVVSFPDLIEGLTCIHSHVMVNSITGAGRRYHIIGVGYRI